MTIDPLSDILRSVRLTGGVFLDVHFSAPWCVTSQITLERTTADLFSPAELIGYHFVLDGRLQLFIEDEPAIEVRGGEIVLLPRNDCHTLASGPGLVPLPADALIQPASNGGLARIVHGGGGEPTHLVCGFLASGTHSNPLVAGLPRALKLDIREGASRDWVEASVRFAASELAEGRLASSGLMARLSELLFVEAVRNYASRNDAVGEGWLKGLKDPHVGRALALIHRDLSAQWTAEELARQSGLSRSAFVERFTTLVGTPPIRYLTTWRLLSAQQQLCETDTSIAHLAYSVGYQSEEAFSRAFKREFGLPPSRWKDRQASVGTPDGTPPIAPQPSIATSQTGQPSHRPRNRGT